MDFDNNNPSTARQLHSQYKARTEIWFLLLKEEFQVHLSHRAEETSHKIGDVQPYAERRTTSRRTSNRQPHYLPTPQAIREECRRIRESWSDEEYRKRSGYAQGSPKVTLRYVHIASVLQHTGRR